MWRESSSVKAVNLVEKYITVTEIMNFSYGIVFYWRTLYIGANKLLSLSLSLIYDDRRSTVNFVGIANMCCCMTTAAENSYAIYHHIIDDEFFYDVTDVANCSSVLQKWTAVVVDPEGFFRFGKIPIPVPITA